MADFIFRITSEKLTPQQQHQIASAIQGAVLKELAQLDVAGAQPTADCLFRPVTWAGGMMIPPGDIANVTGTTLTVTVTTATRT